MVKDEEEYVAYSVLSMLPHVDEMIVVEGGSSDGTLQVLEQVKAAWDHEDKMQISTDLRSGTELAQVRTDMLRRCSGEWVLRLEGDEVYDDATARRVAQLLRQDHPKDVLSIGWPYWFFVDDFETIVPVGEPHTLATIAVRNVEGLHGGIHDRGGNETFFDEGWFDADGKEVSIHHPQDWPSIVCRDFGVHHYAWFKRSSRHHEYAKSCKRTAWPGRHPEVFERYDARPWMKAGDFADPSTQARSRLLRAPLPRSRSGAPRRVLGNYLSFVRDAETWLHVKDSALSFCKHSNKAIDLILWDNDSEPRYRDALAQIFASFEWRSFELRVVPKTEGGPGVGSQNQRVQRAILANNIERCHEFDFVFTQEDDYWYSPAWIERIIAAFEAHPDVDLINPIDGPFLHSDCRNAGWVADVINPIVDGEIRPTLYANGKPLYLRDESLEPRRVGRKETGGIDLVFSRHIDGSNWYRTSMLERLGSGMLEVVDKGHGGWEHIYDWCWPDFAMAEWLHEHGVKIACPQPSLHQHRTRPGKGEYSSPSFPAEWECV